MCPRRCGFKITNGWPGSQKLEESILSISVGGRIPGIHQGYARFFIVDGKISTNPPHFYFGNPSQKAPQRRESSSIPDTPETSEPRLESYNPRILKPPGLRFAQWVTWVMVARVFNPGGDTTSPLNCHPNEAWVGLKTKSKAKNRAENPGPNIQNPALHFCDRFQPLV